MPRAPLALFGAFPALAARLPVEELADLPTPVRPLPGLARAAGLADAWLKDDGVSSAAYGGNKVRKLEFLLADARRQGARSVVTFGYAGSNHATATAVHARRVGLASVSILLPQLGAEYVRRNLLVSAAVGAEIREFPTRNTLMAGAALALLRRRLRDGASPCVVAPGGSSPLGTVGFVSAAYELAAQVRAGLLPMPRRLYAAAGSLGTVVGLGIGLAALRTPTTVVGVRVVDERFVNESRLAGLWKKTVALLRASDPSFPDVGAPAGRIELRGEFFGGEYALDTPEGQRAAAMAREHEGLHLDVTYTAKALACMISDAGRHDGPVLFWNTCNSADLDALAATASPSMLPRRLRRYFD